MLSDVRHRRGRRKRVVLAPQRLGAQVQAKLTSFARATVAIGKVHRGERAISRKPSRREGRCDHRLYLWFLRLRSFFCARAPGAAATRPSLRPRLFEGDGPCKPRTRMRRENAKSHPLHCLTIGSGTIRTSSPRRPGPITTGPHRDESRLLPGATVRFRGMSPSFAGTTTEGDHEEKAEPTERTANATAPSSSSQAPRPVPRPASPQRLVPGDISR